MISSDAVCRSRTRPRLALAEKICGAVESKGIRCWISTRDVGPGENYQDTIYAAIHTAKFMILVFTENASQSEEVKKEPRSPVEAKPSSSRFGRSLSKPRAPLPTKWRPGNGSTFSRIGIALSMRFAGGSSVPTRPLPSSNRPGLIPMMHRRLPEPIATEPALPAELPKPIARPPKQGLPEPPPRAPRTGGGFPFKSAIAIGIVSDSRRGGDPVGTRDGLDGAQHAETVGGGRGAKGHHDAGDQAKDRRPRRPAVFVGDGGAGGAARGAV